MVWLRQHVPFLITLRKKPAANFVGLTKNPFPLAKIRGFKQYDLNHLV